MPGLISISALVAVLLSIVAAFWTLSQDQASHLEAPPKFSPIHIGIRDGNASAKRLAQGLTYATISDSASPDHLRDAEAMAGLHAHIQHSFPLAHSTLTVEKVPSAAALQDARA